MPGETNVQAPTTMLNTDALEAPTEITDPKLKKKIKQSDSGIESASGEDEEDDDEEPRGRPRTAGSSRPQSAGGDSAINVNEVSGTGNQNFIFLGDFVDRGYFSLETFTLLMCLKALWVLHLPLDLYQANICLGILTRSPSFEAIMNPARSPKSTASTKSARPSTETRLSGRVAAKSSISWFLPLSSMVKSSVSTVV